MYNTARINPNCSCLDMYSFYTLYDEAYKSTNSRKRTTVKPHSARTGSLVLLS